VRQEIPSASEKTVYTAEAVNELLLQVVRRAAEPVSAGDSVGQQIDRAARRLRVPRGFVKRLWYRESGTVAAHVALTLLEHETCMIPLRRRLAELQAELARLKES
jgi:hypothetical protein